MTCQVPARPEQAVADQAVGLQGTDALPGLPHFTERQVGLHNRLHKRRAPWPMPGEGQALAVTWGCGSGAVVDPVDVTLMIGALSVQLQLPARLLERSGSGLRSGETDERAPDALTETDLMLLELAWLGWIEPLEGLIGEPVRLVPGTQPWPARAAIDDVRLPLELRLGDLLPMAAAVQMNAEAAERIADWLDHDGPSARNPLGGLRLSLAAEAGEAPLTLGELRSLAPGDVVMLDCLPEQQVQLRLGQTFQSRARHSGEHLECLAALTAINRDRNDSMTDTPTAAATDLDVSLDELPLKLVCQIGSVEVSLAQLQEMGPGTLLKLTDTTQGVDLMVGGRRIGRGELVTIGDGLGVRLLGFNAP